MNQAVIQGLKSVIVNLPTIRPHKLAMHTMNRQTLVIPRLRCSNGIEGLGEAATIGGLVYGSESPESIKSNLGVHFAPLLLGQPADNVSATMQRLDRHIRDNASACSTVETALPDTHGKRLGLTVSELLGGRLRDSLEVTWALASSDTGRDTEEVGRMLDLRRHRHFRLKIGTGEVDADMTHAIAIKRALGEHTSVRVDASQAQGEGVTQRAHATLGDNGIALIEQPIARHDRIGLAHLSNRGGMPIMADGAIESIEDAFHLAREGAAPVFTLKIAKNDGPRAVLRSATIAEAAGIGLYGGTVFESGIGTLAVTHAFVTLSRLAWHSELFGLLLLTEDILLESPRHQDFRSYVPHAPGPGLALDEEHLTCFRRR